MSAKLTKPPPDGIECCVRSGDRDVEKCWRAKSLQDLKQGIHSRFDTNPNARITVREGKSLVTKAWFTKAWLADDKVYSLQFKSHSLPFATVEEKEAGRLIKVSESLSPDDLLIEYHTFSSFASGKTLQMTARRVAKKLTALLYPLHGALFYGRETLGITTSILQGVASLVESEGRPGRECAALFLEMGRTCYGDSAHGVLDYAFLVHSLVVAVMQKSSGSFAPLFVQLLAARDENVRTLQSWYPGVPASKMKELYNEVPSYGVVSLGSSWCILKYELRNGKWHASRIDAGRLLDVNKETYKSGELENKVCIHLREVGSIVVEQIQTLSMLKYNLSSLNKRSTT